MREIIIYHKKNYSNYRHFKKRAITKEFWINITFLVFIVLGFLFLLFNAKGMDEENIKWICGIVVTFCILMLLYITHLERYTTYFVNDNKEYKKQLERKLINEFKIKKATQLNIVINSITEERDRNIKKFGIAIPYIGIGVTLIALLSNTSNFDMNTTLIICLIYFFLIFIFHGILKFAELFFNLYSDNLTTLIKVLIQIQLDWMEKEGVSKGGKYRKRSRI
ncbi:hypothetical protein ACFO4U_04405 [Exiguobacterium profundum]|uniref:hypothetical protein n=1 Tax=Exiguobacterium TaxID=33986 RepID=UPI001BFC8221|nr:MULTISPECIES: hypothetical protein [Exiguobacterium]MCT4796898.1 hypothetical protein [Exiguobacterium profundum]